jgi:hypothetical protein
MASSELENYSTLLKIRRTAGRRDVTIVGGIFIAFFVAMIAFGMLDRLTGRSLYLVVAMVAVFGFGFLTTWVKLEITKSSIDLIDNLLRIEGE